MEHESKTDKLLFLRKLHQEQELEPSHLITLADYIAKNDSSYLKRAESLIVRKIKALFEDRDTWLRNREDYSNGVTILMNTLCFSIQNDKSHWQWQTIFPFWKTIKSLFKEVARVDVCLQTSNKQGKKPHESQRQRTFYQYQLSVAKGTYKKRIQQLSLDVYDTFPRSEKWAQLFQSINAKRSIQHKSEMNLPFLMEIHNQRPMPKDYICCSEFYYQNQCIFRPNIDSYFDVQIVQNSSQITLDNTFIADTVLSYMNSKGGLILFDVTGDALDVRVRGNSQLTQAGKQQFQRRIANLIQPIRPALQNKKHYEIEFVPVIEDPSKGLGIKKEDGKISRNYLTSCYVPRMKVFPLNSQDTYYLQLQQGRKQYFYIRKKRQNVPLQGTQIHELIVSRFITNKDKQYSHKHCIHPITTPEPGISVYDLDDEPVHEERREKQQSKFKYMSLLVCDRFNIQVVSQYLTNCKIDHQWQESFPHYKFRLTPTTYILVHDLKFDKVKECIEGSNLRYANNASEVKVISTASNLETMNQYRETDRQNIKQWFKSKFPDSDFRFEEKQNKMFLIMKTNYEAIFMYLFLDNCKIKAKFRKVLDKNQRRSKGLLA